MGLLPKRERFRLVFDHQQTLVARDRHRFRRMRREGAHIDVGLRMLDIMRHPAPRVRGAFAASSCRELPLGLGGQARARPLGEGHGIGPRDLHHGECLLPLDARARTARVTPVRTRHPAPPLRHVAQVDRAGRRREDEGAGHEQVRGRRRGPGWELPQDLLDHRRALRDRHISRGRHEGREARVRDARGIHEEAIDPDLMDGPLRRQGELAIVAHRERTARDPHHARRRLTGRVHAAARAVGQATRRDDHRRTRQDEHPDALGEEGHGRECSAHRPAAVMLRTAIRGCDATTVAPGVVHGDGMRTDGTRRAAAEHRLRPRR